MLKPAKFDQLVDPTTLLLASRRTSDTAIDVGLVSSHLVPSTAVVICHEVPVRKSAVDRRNVEVDPVDLTSWNSDGNEVWVGLALLVHMRGQGSTKLVDKSRERALLSSRGVLEVAERE